MSRYDHKIETSLEGIEHCDNLLKSWTSFQYVTEKEASTNPKDARFVAIKDYLCLDLLRNFYPITRGFFCLLIRK